jgi:hypothetical protein
VVGIGATAFEQEAVPRRLVATPQAQYTVYAGGGIEAGIARAEALQRAAQGKTASTLDEVGLQAAEAYIAWARQLEIAHLARENLQALQRIRDDVRRIVEVDAGRMVDLSQAEVRVNAAALVVEQREGELAQAAARLARYWPRPLPARPEGLDEEPGGRPASLGEALAYGGDRHPLLAQGLAQAQAAEAALTQARAQMRPRVELQVAHQLNPYTLRPGLNTQLQVNMPVFDAGSGAAGVAAADAQARAVLVERSASPSPNAAQTGPMQTALVEFKDALGDDLNLARAIAALNTAIGETPAGDAKAEVAALDAMDSVLGVFERNAALASAAADDLAAKVEALLERRRTARAAKDWAESDRVRDELTALGVRIKDGPQGTSWERAV